MNIASVVQRKNNTRIQNAIRKSNSDIHRLIQQYVDAMIEPDIPEWIPKALHLEVDEIIRVITDEITFGQKQKVISVEIPLQRSSEIIESLASTIGLGDKSTEIASLIVDNVNIDTSMIHQIVVQQLKKYL